VRFFFPKIFIFIKGLFLFSLIQVWFSCSVAFAINQPRIHHEIKVVLDIDRQVIDVEDSIHLPDSLLNKKETFLYFSLNEGLKPISLTHGVLIKQDLFKKFSETHEQGVSLRHYSVYLPQGLGNFVIKYQGQMYQLTPGKRGKDIPGGYKTPRLISPEGIYLDGSSYWVPSFGEMFMTFSLETKILEKWDVVSQGKRTQHKTEKGWKQIKWESLSPQVEIFLIAGKFFEYGSKIDNIFIMAFLRTPDQELANRYLQVNKIIQFRYYCVVGMNIEYVFYL